MTSNTNILAFNRMFKFLNAPQVKSYSAISIIDAPSSTRFNNQERFSLEQLKQNKRRLESFKKLDKNWNGYDGEPIDEIIIERVHSILSTLDYQPKVYPTGRGTIQIEKYIDEDNLVEIEVSKDEIFLYQVIHGEETELSITDEQVNYFISKMYES